MSNVRHQAIMTKTTDNTDEKQEAVQPSGEVVPHPLSIKPSPFMEEINTVRLEGRFFSFDPKRSNIGPTRQKFQSTERNLEIVVHPAYGRPTILAYRLLQHVFLKITKEGKPFPDMVSFSYREIGRLIGRDIFGGKDLQEIERAIGQLKNTEIIETTLNEKKSQTRKIRYSLIVTSGIITEGAGEGGKVKAVALQIHPLIMESMRRDHFIILNWATIANLPPLSATLYKRLYLHFSNLYQNKHDAQTLTFEKDYATICDEWFGGLQPRAFKADITRQLKAHFDALRQTGLIKSAEIVRRSKGEGFKLVFKPGKGFFRDYEIFYLGKHTRILQFERAADEAQIQQPLTIARYFVESRLGTTTPNDTYFSGGDIEFARELIERLGVDECRPFIDYALASAKETKFDMKTLRATRQYLAGWEANKTHRETARMKEKARAEKSRLESLKETYNTMVKRHAAAYLERLTDEQRGAIKEQAVRNTALKNRHAPGFQVFVSIEERRIALTLEPVPTFEEWVLSQS